MSESQPLRVLWVLTRANQGGPARVAFDLMPALAEHGVQVLLAVGSVGSLEAELPAQAFTGSGVVELPVGSLAVALERGPAAAGVVQLPGLVNRWWPGRGQQVAGALGALIKGFKPQLVHSHTAVAGYLARKVARRCGVPTAHTFHGHVLRDYFDPVRSGVFRRIERRLAEHTDMLVAVSPSCADELSQLGVASRERWLVLPPAVQAERFQQDRESARQRLQVGPGELAIGFVGRLVQIKQPRSFLAAVRQIAEVSGVPVAGLLVGSGPLLPRLQVQARRLAEPNLRFRFVGAVADVAPLMAGLDVLLTTSRREGCPVAVLEAFAASVPVVGFDVPGVRDLLGHWGDGVLVPASAGPNGLARAVRTLLADGDRRGAIVAKARDSLERFSLARAARDLRAAYGAVCVRRAATD
jgi:glycosyltransferase involved in cell wall biosynthesis